MAWTPLPNVVEVTVETPVAKEFVLDPATTVVVVVDMQNTFCHTGNQRSFDVIEGNARLLEKARESGAKVIYVISLRQPDSPNYHLFHRRMYHIPGTWNTEIVPELTPQPGEPVIQKWSHDVWSWWGIEALLEQEGITNDQWTVLVTGVSAAACAHAAALGFSNRHYRTLIPLDCTAASIEAEARTWHQFMSPGYSYNVDFTLSTLVTFEPALREPQDERRGEPALAPSA